MIIFVNGPFGVGKTTAVTEVLARMPNALVIDPEKVGHMLWAQLPEPLRMEEFELEPVWPALTRTLVQEASRVYARTILVPMTIARPPVFAAIVAPLRDDGLAVAHVTLLASPTTIRNRLRLRGEGPDRWGELSWEGLQVERCLATLTRPEFATHIDTAGSSVRRNIPDHGGCVDGDTWAQEAARTRVRVLAADPVRSGHGRGV